MTWRATTRTAPAVAIAAWLLAATGCQRGTVGPPVGAQPARQEAPHADAPPVGACTERTTVLRRHDGERPPRRENADHLEERTLGLGEVLDDRDRDDGVEARVCERKPLRLSDRDPAVGAGSSQSDRQRREVASVEDRSPLGCPQACADPRGTAPPG